MAISVARTEIYVCVQTHQLSSGAGQAFCCQAQLRYSGETRPLHWLMMPMRLSSVCLGAICVALLSVARWLRRADLAAAANFHEFSCTSTPWKLGTLRNDHRPESIFVATVWTVRVAELSLSLVRRSRVACLSSGATSWRSPLHSWLPQSQDALVQHRVAFSFERSTPASKMKYDDYA